MITRHESVSRLIDLLVAYDVGAVVITENELPVGIATERDIVERVLKFEKNLDDTRVEEIMSSPLISIESNKSIKEAIDLLRDKHIRRLGVLEKGKLIGLTTERRLLNVAHDTYLERSNSRDIEVTYTATDKPIISYISSYPPRECGIATFTSDLVDSINHQGVLPPPVVVAINDEGEYYDYSGEVKLQIEREKRESYKAVASKINSSGIRAVNIQHEYGLFGGDWGDYLLTFMEKLKKPMITTLHTILPDPNTDAERVLTEVIRLSYRIVVLARAGSRILEERYDALPDKIRYIPHGCPNVPFLKSKTPKTSLGFKDRYVLSTFGLISSGKGIEYAIKALPEIIPVEPRVLYIIIGETHPDVRKHEGESYRQSLYDLVNSLGVEKNVRFVNRFLNKGDLIRFLQATDTYVLPYPNREQISSGTMLYALSTGKAIVTTPFLHAEEVIYQGAALRCEFKDPHSIAEHVNSFIKDDGMRASYERRAYEYSREMIWPTVAMRYINEFYKDLGM
jgi:glycosyltransferase involved in cell wall biosynthesis/predicted transcriptional regulator